MKKQILILAMVVLMLGVVFAEENRTLYYSEGINLPLNVVAGSSFEVDFSYVYLDDHSNPESSPLIIQLNFSSNDSDYPVWRNDFEVSGRVEKYVFFGMIGIGTINFECNNSENQIIEHSLDSQEVWAGNGTFYCYNEEGDLELEEYDEVYLNITSNSALSPGKYNLTASMFYLTDERAPFVNITNKNVFEKYYREIDNVEIIATINDGSEIVNKWGTAFLGYENLTFPWTHNDYGGLYYFSRNTPEDIVEGDYDLFIFAEDDYNNTGNDSVVLKIDRTGPEIILIQPNGSVYDEILPIEANISDEKAGVDYLTAEYRLREMNETNICPESGSGTWDCYNSGWLSLPYVSGDLFFIEVNTTEVGLNSGEYWLEIKAYDILGNKGLLE